MIRRFETMEPVIHLSAASHRTAPRKLQEGLIAPSCEACAVESIESHASEPIKSIEDIYRVSAYLIENQRYRDNMLFITGINFGLRVSDLLRLKFIDLIDESFSFREGFAILEKKTKNTRKKKRNRYVSINEAVIEAVTLYLEHTPNVALNDYLFRSESNNGAKSEQPLHRNSVDRILKEAAEALGLNIKVGTHTLRKTFGYHQMLMGGNDPRRLLLLQKIFGHSSAAQTLDYIGITEDEISDAYRDLNLGLRPRPRLLDSTIYEQELTIA